MEYRIRPSRGGYVVDKGLAHSGGAQMDGLPGVTMPAFIVYESRAFDTLRQAVAYMRQTS